MRLCGRLILNSRTPYRELADELGLSLQAVHRRIQVMQEQGVIAGFPGGLAIGFVNPVVLYVFGTSNAANMDRVVADLRRDDRTYIVLVCARNYLSIGALLRGHDEIEDYMSFVQRSAGLTDIAIGIMSLTQLAGEKVGWADREKELSTLDYRIIDALRPDARRPVEAIAAELNVSAATARRRLNRLMEIGAFSASMDWRPSASGQIEAQLHVLLKEGADRNAVGGALTVRSSAHVVALVTFGNLPRFLLLVVWARSLKGLGELVSSCEGVEGVEAVSPNVIISEARFETWIDKMVTERARTRRPASTMRSDLQPTD